jgi:hypothetical protein
MRTCLEGITPTKGRDDGVSDVDLMDFLIKKEEEASTHDH